MFHENKMMTPVEWAETNRVMTSDVSNFAGRFKYDRNPYMMEIVNHLMPSSPARKIAIMKGAQIGVSTCVLENGIGWIIKHAPANILLASADLDLVKEQFETKLDNMIQNSGLRDYIRPNVIKKRNSRTGDTNNSKEFPGGRLYGRSVQNAGKWRQTSFKFGFIDDFEAADRDDSREGSVVNLINQRFASYGSTHKIFYISTPALKKTSNIEPLYEAGDQRKFVMPCPCCGVYIPFEFQLKKDDKIYGIVWDLDDKNKLIEGSVRYRCPECEESFLEAGNKKEMLNTGYWLPTAEPSEPGFFSYHISALYAAPGMYNWEYYVRQFLEASEKKSTAMLKTFKNVVLGETWEDRGKSPKATVISKNTRSYPINIIPYQLSEQDGNGQIVMITCACDLNGFCQGVNKDYCDARLDYEIIAHSKTGATYSIDAGSIGTFQRGMKPSEDREMWTYKLNHANNVWDKFEEIISRDYKTDHDREVSIMISGVDTGAFTQHAYQFIERMNNKGIWCFGLKGELESQVMRLTDDTACFKKSKDRNDLILVKTNKLKDTLAENMQIVWNQGTDIECPANFMSFPVPSDNKYTVNGFFEQFESEEKTIEANKNGHSISYKWEKRHNSVRNHFWDCRVYNMALRDIVVWEVLTQAKIKYPTWAEFCTIMLD